MMLQLLQSQKKPASADLFSDDDGYSQVLGKQLQDPWAAPSRPQASAFKSPGNDPWSAAPPTAAGLEFPLYHNTVFSVFLNSLKSNIVTYSIKMMNVFV